MYTDTCMDTGLTDVVVGSKLVDARHVANDDDGRAVFFFHHQKKNGAVPVKDGVLSRPSVST
jgi:hypothetical protein